MIAYLNAYHPGIEFVLSFQAAPSACPSLHALAMLWITRQCAAHLGAMFSTPVAPPLDRVRTIYMSATALAHHIDTCAAQPTIKQLLPVWKPQKKLPLTNLANPARMFHHGAWCMCVFPFISEAREVLINQYTHLS